MLDFQCCFWIWCQKARRIEIFWPRERSKNLKKAKPPAFVDPAVVRHITVGNFEDDLEKLQACDWVLEAVAENLEIKRALLNKVVPTFATTPS